MAVGLGPVGVLNPEARTGELLPLDLATEPALVAFVNAVDLAEVTAAG